MFSSKIPKGNKAVPDPDFSKLKSTTRFNKSELKALFIRYCDIVAPNGQLSKHSFINQAELISNNYAASIFDDFSECNNNKIDFESFCLMMALISHKIDRRSILNQFFKVISKKEYNTNNSSANHSEDSHATIDIELFKVKLQTLSNGCMENKTIDIICELIKNKNHHQIESVLYNYEIQRKFTTGAFI